MEVVTMEKKAFDLMMARYDALVQEGRVVEAQGKRQASQPVAHRT